MNTTSKEDATAIATNKLLGNIPMEDVELVVLDLCKNNNLKLKSTKGKKALLRLYKKFKKDSM